MTTDFKQPRYVLPIVVLPFLLLLFYAFKSSPLSAGQTGPPADSLQTGLAQVSPEIQSKAIGGKLDAFRDRFRQADGYTAVSGLGEESGAALPPPASLYDEREKFLLDSLAKRMKEKSAALPGSYALDGAYSHPGNYVPGSDRLEQADDALRKALSDINKEKALTGHKPAEDPMQLFRAQLKLIDSLSKANEPSAKMSPAQTAGATSTERVAEKALQVRKAGAAGTLFTTIRKDEKSTMIPAVLDEELTVFSGSRLRIRLLEDVMAGPYLLPRQSYLYGQVSGFSAQRVLLNVNAAFVNGEVLPLKLEVYDNDGLQGIYVPASVFREFSKELSSSAATGANPGGFTTDSRMAMSVISGVFQSANTAVNKLIRRNKARLKYNTRIYLIDGESLKNKQNSFK